MAEEDLNNFLAVAEELEVKGLTCGKNFSEGNTNHHAQSSSTLKFQSTSNHQHQDQVLNSAQGSLLFLKTLVGQPCWQAL